MIFARCISFQCEQCAEGGKMKRYKQTIVEANRPRTRNSRNTRGGGVGEKEDVHGSGVYPSSGPWPKENATVRAPADWNERTLRKRGSAKTSPKISAKVERALEGAKRKAKSKLDEAYQQGESARKVRSGRIF